MDKKLITIIGKVDSINVGPHFCNTTIMIETKQNVNIKLDSSDAKKLKIGKIYQFSVIEVLKDEEKSFKNVSFVLVEDIFSPDELAKMYQTFYEYAPIPLDEIKTQIETYLKKIKNPIIKSVTTEVYNKFKSHFYLHPAATKFHHAYYGGLSYHTLTMLKMIDPLVKIYPFLDVDILYAGALLHDVSKIDEISGVDGEYTIEGMLLGHIVMVTLEIEQVAAQKGYQDTEELLMLKHTLIAHHGMLMYGSPKRPQTPEALILWYIDTIDSKFSVLGDELAKTKPGEFTGPIQVLDKVRFYKSKIK